MSTKHNFKPQKQTWMHYYTTQTKHNNLKRRNMWSKNRHMNNHIYFKLSVPPYANTLTYSAAISTDSLLKYLMITNFIQLYYVRVHICTLNSSFLSFYLWFKPDWRYFLETHNLLELIISVLSYELIPSSRCKMAATIFRVSQQDICYFL